MIPADGSAGGGSAYAFQQAAQRTTGWHNQCLRFVRSACGAPAQGGYAYRAWQLAKHKHPNDRNPPAGVPMFFYGGVYGHTSLSAYQGRTWSSDVIVDDQVRKTTIATIENKWGMRYLGWTEDVNGVRVRDIGEPHVSLSTVHKSIHRDQPYVGNGTIARALHKEGYVGFTNGSKWGRGKRRAYKKWQKKCGFGGTGADGIPGKMSLTKLGNKHHFKVVD